jgi:uncharacterized repeat protein (TIGR01451 family)
MTNTNVLKVLIALVVVLGAIQISSIKSYAETECVEQYGGGETCIENKEGELEVNKEVYNPETGDWEDHIDGSDYTFGESETIKFRISVKNVGDIRIEDINLEDILPSFVKYRDGDGDGKDDDTKVEFEDFDLNPGEKKTFEFTVKVDSDLPNDDRICLTNIATAEGEFENSDNNVDDSDYANFCLENGKVKGKESPKSLPVTGGSLDLNRQEMANLILAGSISLGLILVGFGLKKIAN